MKSKTLSSEDIVYLKECLLKLEFTVLPTVQDKWVSLHPSFGLVCWCDDEKLRKEFKHSDNLDFLYFGNLSDDEKERLQAKVSVLMQTLGIPSISEVKTLSLSLSYIYTHVYPSLCVVLIVAIDPVLNYLSVVVILIKFFLWYFVLHSNQPGFISL